MGRQRDKQRERERYKKEGRLPSISRWTIRHASTEAYANRKACNQTEICKKS